MPKNLPGGEKISCICPYCGSGNRVPPTEAEHTACFTCGRPFRVHLGPDGRNATMKELPEPLFLPRGSVRALVSLMVTGAYFALIVKGRAIPEPLLGLLLAIMGYYFGFRQRPPRRSGFEHSEGLRSENPLHLPGGSIRLLLLGVYLLGAGLLFVQGRLHDAALLEFHVILAGLAIGFMAARLMATHEGTTWAIMANHGKGVVVLAAALTLSMALLADSPLAVARPWLLLAPICLISFYYGSKS